MENETTSLGSIRINNAEYGESIVIEQYGYYNHEDKPSWAVPQHLANSFFNEGTIQSGFKTLDEACLEIGKLVSNVGPYTVVPGVLKP